MKFFAGIIIIGSIYGFVAFLVDLYDFIVLSISKLSKIKRGRKRRD